MIPVDKYKWLKNPVITIILFIVVFVLVLLSLIALTSLKSEFTAQTEAQRQIHFLGASNTQLTDQLTAEQKDEKICAQKSDGYAEALRDTITYMGNELDDPTYVNSTDGTNLLAKITTEAKQGNNAKCPDATITLSQ